MAPSHAPVRESLPWNSHYQLQWNTEDPGSPHWAMIMAWLVPATFPLLREGRPILERQASQRSLCSNTTEFFCSKHIVLAMQ